MAGEREGRGGGEREVRLPGSASSKGEPLRYETIHVLQTFTCWTRLALNGRLDVPLPPKTHSLEAAARKSIELRADGGVPCTAPPPSDLSGLHVEVASVNCCTSVW